MDNQQSHLTVVRPMHPSKRDDSMTPFRSALATTSIQRHVNPEDATWACEHCGNIVPPKELPSGLYFKRRACECQTRLRHEREAREQHALWLTKQRERTYGGWLGKPDARIVREMSSKTFASWDRTRFSDAYAAARTFARRPQGNLMFEGSFGTGKTLLESAIINELLEVGREMADGTYTPMTSLFASAPQFFEAYQNAVFSKSADKTWAISIIESAISTPLLVIDDVDKARPTDFRNDTYFLIFDERYKARRPTIISTNRQESLADYLGENVAYSRMMRGLVTVSMFGDDYRLEEEV